MALKYTLLIATLNILSITFFSTSAVADDSALNHTGWYLGGSVGAAEVETEMDVSYDTQSEAESASLSIIGGHNFEDIFGIELAINLYGDVSDEDQYSTRGDYDASLSTLSITPKWTVHITDIFSLYAKAGLIIMIYTEEYNDEDHLGDDELVWVGGGGTVGVGAQFSLTDNFRLRFSADIAQGDLEGPEKDNDYYHIEKDKIIDAPDIEVSTAMASVGVYYQF